MTSRAERLGAVTSPVRQEIIMLLDRSPMTVAEMARRLGRSRQALYHHLKVLLDAGLVRESGSIGEGRSSQRLFTRIKDRSRIAVAATNTQERRAAGRAITAMLRLTARESVECLESDEDIQAVVALRGKSWLSKGDLRRVGELLKRVENIFVSGKTQQRSSSRQDQKLFSITIVMTPSRMARTQGEKEAT